MARGFTTFRNGGDRRHVISIGKLVKKSDGPEDIDRIIKTMMKYGMDGKEKEEWGTMRILLDFENVILDLFEKNKITVDGAKTVLWQLLTALYEDELIEEPHRQCSDMH